MSFSANATVAATWAEVGPRERESCQDLDCSQEILKDDSLEFSPPKSLVATQPPVHPLQPSSNAITWHIPLKLQISEASGRN